MVLGEVAQPDTITVSGFAEEEIEAIHADISVTIRGSSLFSGNAALTKAREVAALVAELKAIGIAEGNIELRGVEAETSTGTLGNKTSSATYSLMVTKTPPALLADAVGVIASAKTASLGGVSWQYGDMAAVQLRLLGLALEQAQAKANLAARTLDVKLIGVRTLTENFDGGEVPMPKMRGGSLGMVRARMSVSQEELGLEVTNRKRVSHTVVVEYRVSSMGEGS